MTYIMQTAEEALAARDERYPFTFILAGDPVQVVRSNTRTGIVEALIEGYADLPEPSDGFDARLDARLELLAAYAGSTQAVVTAAASDDDFTDDELTAMLTPKDGQVLEFSHWSSSTALLLLATNYAPYTDVPAPSGDAIIWVDPHTETLFLASLARLGMGDLWIDEEAPDLPVSS